MTTRYWCMTVPSNEYWRTSSSGEVTWTLISTADCPLTIDSLWIQEPYIYLLYFSHFKRLKHIKLVRCVRTVEQDCGESTTGTHTLPLWLCHLSWHGSLGFKWISQHLIFLERAEEHACSRACNHLHALMLDDCILACGARAFKLILLAIAMVNVTVT